MMGEWRYNWSAVKCFAPLSVGRVQTPILQCVAVWLTIFWALVLYDCACDIDHESVIKLLLLLLLLLLSTSTSANGNAQIVIEIKERKAQSLGILIN